MGSILYCHSVGSRNQVHIISIVYRCLYLLNHLLNLISIFYRWRNQHSNLGNCLKILQFGSDGHKSNILAWNIKKALIWDFSLRDFYEATNYYLPHHSFFFWLDTHDDIFFSSNEYSNHLSLLKQYAEIVITNVLDPSCSTFF